MDFRKIFPIFFRVVKKSKHVGLCRAVTFIVGAVRFDLLKYLLNN